VYGKPSKEFLAGEISKKYYDNDINLRDVIIQYLHVIELDLDSEESTKLYIADDYFDWHTSPETHAMQIVLPFIERYLPEFELSINKFSV